MWFKVDINVLLMMMLMMTVMMLLLLLLMMMMIMIMMMMMVMNVDNDDGDGDDDDCYDDDGDSGADDNDKDYDDDADDNDEDVVDDNDNDDDDDDDQVCATCVSTLCASLRSRNAHGHFTRVILYVNLQEKWPRTPRTSFCASLHGRKAHGHVTRAILYGIHRENGRGHLRQRFVRACAVETHMSISQEQFVSKFTRKWPRTPPGTSFCASLRSRNAHGHFTRAILCGSLKGKCRTPRTPPRLNTRP